MLAAKYSTKRSRDSGLTLFHSKRGVRVLGVAYLPVELLRVCETLLILSNASNILELLLVLNTCLSCAVCDGLKKEVSMVGTPTSLRVELMTREGEAARLALIIAIALHCSNVTVCVCARARALGARAVRVFILKKKNRI